MTVQLQETPDHLKAERSFADFLQGQFDCKLVKMSLRQKIDYCGIRGSQIEGFYELKCRENTRGKYSTVFMSLSKWNAGRELSEDFALPFCYCIEWTDACGFVLITKALASRCRLVWQECYQRDGSKESDPVVLIGLGEFQLLP
jgi:hypothetical protein